MTELARITTLEELVTALKHRRAARGLSQIAVDQISGLPDGYTAKIECGMKGLGKLSIPLLLGALNVDLAVVHATSTHRDKTGQSADFFTRRARKAAEARWAATPAKQRRKMARAAAKARWRKVKVERERQG